MKLPYLAFLLLPLFAFAKQDIDFNTQIKSLLSNRCIACHGPDEENREAGLRLDTFDGATRDIDGYSAIVPGNPEESEILFRVTLEDGDQELMPPKGRGERLSEEEVALLTEWIKQGAKYDKHWSYKSPVRAQVPEKEHPVDFFIDLRLKKEGLSRSELADKRTLARRVSLDLIGLPPTLDEVNEYLTDKSSDAYSKYVDRLLVRSEFGEHWARMWLDLARYADSAGYADDRPRTIWGYRDYVIRAFNNNLPFDQFTIEQLAGDLLPNPSQEQMVATAFHRNTQTNNEGGTNDEEFRNVAVVDRVNTTFATWMGTTMACAQCHTHKYDSITHHEYFQVFDVFNQTEDADRRDESPVLELKDNSVEMRRKGVIKQIEDQKKLISDILEKQKSKGVEMPDRSGPVMTRFVRVTNLVKQGFLHLAEVEIYADGKNVARSGKASQSSTGFNGPAQLAIDGNTNGDYAKVSVTHTDKEDNPWLEIDLGASLKVDEIKIYNRADGGTGYRIKEFQIAALDEKRETNWVQRVKKTPNPDHAAIVPATFETFTKEQNQAVAQYNLDADPTELILAQRKLKDLQNRLNGIKGPTVPVLRERPKEKRRNTFVHLRGSYLSHGDQVHAGFPTALFDAPDGVSAPTRLDFAKWVMDPNNPLTSRVTANRFWEKLFGIGLVATSEEFGSQGELPSHPKLLDWLATEMVRLKWDVKAFIKLLVTSETYRQSSHVTDAMAARDPANRLLARGPRVRLSAEMVRDQALAVSGLLSKKMFGPPVRPPQPDMGIKAAFGGGIDWKTSTGEDRFRRGIYTNWRRSNPYPSMATFDAPNREVCTVRRGTTNTPLQALVTMNDPVYIEAAQSLSRKMVASEKSVAEQISKGFEICLSRKPDADELNRLVELFDQVKTKYSQNENLATQMATDPIGPVPTGMNITDLAALTVTSNVLLNLDEILMKR
ncbi:MAG TPA: hypothetical protein DCF87_03415 [Opitutae bacterium]|nr:hypothetical protein [Opitutae bacterium]